MMDAAPIWDILKSIGGWVGAVATFFLGAIWKGYKGHKRKTDALEIRVIRLEIAKDIQEKKLVSVEESIEEKFNTLDNKLDKIVDHLLNKKK